MKAFLFAVFSLELCAMTREENLQINMSGKSAGMSVWVQNWRVVSIVSFIDGIRKTEYMANVRDMPEINAERCFMLFSPNKTHKFL